MILLWVGARVYDRGLAGMGRNCGACQMLIGIVGLSDAERREGEEIRVSMLSLTQGAGAVWIPKLNQKVWNGLFVARK